MKNEFMNGGNNETLNDIKDWYIKFSKELDEKKSKIFKTEEYEGYILTLKTFGNGDGYWNYTRGIVENLNGEIVADVSRNYSSFPYLFFKQDDVTYLFCGFDYQSYTVCNLNTGVMRHFFPKSAENGNGWCIASIDSYDEEEKTIVLNGCYWGGSFDFRKLDLSNINELPFSVTDEWSEDVDDDWDDDEDDD
jgi:hypothetical protein